MEWSKSNSGYNANNVGRDESKRNHQLSDIVTIYHQMTLENLTFQLGT